MRENKKVAVKILKKTFKVPFFADVFQFCHFFYLAIFILLIQNSVRQTLYVKKSNVLENSGLIREMF